MPNVVVERCRSWTMNPSDHNTDQLFDPAFRAWLRQLPQPIRPDESDYDGPPEAATVVGLAQAMERKLRRLYQEWRRVQGEK